MTVQPGPKRPPKSVLTACLEAATAAPSVLNTQPWRFRVDDTGIDVLIDASRQVAVADPDGRELLISVGAALFNLQTALRDHGWQPILRRPNGSRNGVLASLAFGPAAAPDATVRALAAAIGRRRTNREPYADVVVPASVLDELREAAAMEGAILTAEHPVARDALLSLTRTAEDRLCADPAYRQELATWVHPESGHGDGLPPTVLGPGDAAGRVPVRDFGGGSAAGVARFEVHPTLLVLSTRGDRPPQWLRAGQALQRVLLTATVRELATQPMTQPLEVPSVRALISDPAGTLYPQMILRVGYGRPVSASPRRPLRHMLLPG